MNPRQRWPEAIAHHEAWWRREGFVLNLVVPKFDPLAPPDRPAPPADPSRRYLDADWRLRQRRWHLEHHHLLGDALPIVETMIGPGDLGMLLGAEPVFRPETVWYEPIPGDWPRPLRFDPQDNGWWDALLAMVDASTAAARRHGWLVAMPDLIENLDTLAQLGGTQAVLMDIAERPDWVADRLAEINEAYFDVFDRLRERLADETGGNAFAAFGIWGPGRTAKVQCDISCMISPATFRSLAVPALRAQCERLDFSMYHLDGQDAIVHLDALLEIDALDAIEWTPRRGWSDQEKAVTRGGSPQWYDLYRRLRAAGKAVQAIGVRPDDVLPLLDAAGPAGLYMDVWAPDLQTAEALLARVEPYR